MRTTRIFLVCSLAALLIWMPIVPPATASDDDETRINFADDQTVFELVGQVTNFPATPSAPLGTSNQYGYLTALRGIDNVFSGSPQNETTALFTFFNEVTTTRSISNGPLRVIDRDGTTTIYLNSAPASFADPNSFRSGTPIQTSTLHQQVVVDTVTGMFTVVFFNTITSTSDFTLNGTTLELGKEGHSFQTTLTGHLNSPAPPSGHFGGYAVGVGKK